MSFTLSAWDFFRPDNPDNPDSFALRVADTYALQVKVGPGYILLDCMAGLEIEQSHPASDLDPNYLGQLVVDLRK